MDPETILHQLLEAGILVESDDGMLAIGGAYDAKVESFRGADPADEPDMPSVPADADGPGSELLAHHRAVGTFLEVDPDVRLFLAIFLCQFPNPPASDGAPESFLAVRGELVRPIVELAQHAIVYVWEDDSASCERMRETFEELLPAPADEPFTLLAVYFPGWEAELRDEFNVAGAPTTLFVHDGRVDTRLLGAQYTHVLGRAIEMFRTLV